MSRHALQTKPQPASCPTCGSEGPVSLIVWFLCDEPGCTMTSPMANHATAAPWATANGWRIDDSGSWCPDHSGADRG